MIFFTSPDGDFLGVPFAAVSADKNWQPALPGSPSLRTIIIENSPIEMG